MRLHTTIVWVVDGFILFLWLYFVCNYYVALGGNFKAKPWEKICKRQLLYDNYSTKVP
jgi:hypothetical protein